LTQFCRQCHFGESNEANGGTQFRYGSVDKPVTPVIFRTFANASKLWP
jgi:hypothetical protein